MNKNIIIAALAVLTINTLAFSASAADDSQARMVDPNAEMDRGWRSETTKSDEKDVQLTRRIRSAIEKDNSITGSNRSVKISVASGVATLIGRVASKVEERKVVNVVGGVVGRENVRNELSVKRD